MSRFDKLRGLARVFTAAMVFATAASAHATPAAQPDMKRTLQDVADAADGAWNRRDAVSMAAYYNEDATTTIGATHKLSGKAQILDYFTASFKQLPEGMTHRTVVERIEKIGDMYATDSSVYLEFPDIGEGKRLVRKFFTFALVRPGHHGWEFVAVRAIPLSAPAVSPAR